MKIKLEIELDIPDECREYSDDELAQVVFDAYINYASRKHLSDVITWMASTSLSRHIHIRHHQLWADISSQAKVKVVVL